MPDFLQHPDTELLSISRFAFEPEADAVRILLEQTESIKTLEPVIMPKAMSMVEAVRAEGPGSGIEAFLQEYGLDTTEGTALMCLAEALLRIPDTRTADRLIHSTFEDAHWEAHLGDSESFMVNAGSWGLLLSGKAVQFGDNARKGVLSTIRKLISRISEPVVREALKASVRLVGRQFVLGENVLEALKNAKPYGKKGYRFSYDILGEGARSDAQALAYVRAYQEGIALIGAESADKPLLEAPSISVKLSALHPRYTIIKHGRVINELLPRLKDILLRAKSANVAVSIDAEEASRLDIELHLFTTLLEDPDFADWNGIGFVVQAYQKRALHVIDYLAALARKHNRIIPLRLVKGAYWDSEIKYTQINGLPDYPVFTRKEHTDLSYLACAQRILQQAKCFYPQFATHNARTIATIFALCGQYDIAANTFEFQRLHGMGEALHDLILPEAPSRIYAPIGEHKDLLAYLIRRLLENGANTSFVHLLMDKDRTLAELLADPIEAAYSRGATPNPDIPLPVSLYGSARRNSEGIDFGNLHHLHNLLTNIPGTVPETVTDIDMQQLNTCISRACNAQPEWSELPVDTRATILEHAADLIEARRHELTALLCNEAGKTLPDAIAEIREAADYCRYYAAQARKLFRADHLIGPTGESNTLSLSARGVMACISPWNFPLAIFLGQIVACLATGNAVLAKPAEQTRAIGKFAINILHEAGIPKDVLAFTPGSGSSLGNALVNDTRIDGVVFTGSVETAQRINQALATRGGPIVPLIAETGGQNCMIVDSSALLEQAVDDIILSAFGSIGQRCSALRVLFVQSDIADALIILLRGAMQELHIGNPLNPATDCGPVIDADTREQLLTHIARMKKEAKLLASVAAPGIEGHFVSPHVFEINNIKQLEKEVFGPVLHLIRYEADALDDVANAINATGYGLTFGIHSRVQDTIDFFTSRIRAGNIYVNRSMIGAVVGVQPFGGMGLSGTGPKAGGPHYLTRLVVERTISVNTAAVGGNISLLSGTHT